MTKNKVATILLAASFALTLSTNVFSQESMMMQGEVIPMLNSKFKPGDTIIKESASVNSRNVPSCTECVDALRQITSTRAEVESVYVDVPNSRIVFNITPGYNISDSSILSMVGNAGYIIGGIVRERQTTTYVENK